jgi:1-acyl-sn-glycerol-3-phosphate acyltransferase
MLSAAETELFALVAVAALAFALAGYLFRLRKRLALTLAQSFWYGVNCLMSRILWRATVNGVLPVPPGQGAIVVCNHRSPVDPCFIEIATHRAVHWMVAKEYCTQPALAWFMRMAEVIPTRRGGVDTQATKMAIRYAQNGEMVGIFLEGRINTTGQLLLPGRPGAAMIALKARVKVVPCYIQGAPYDGTTLGCMLMPAKVTVRFGQPIDLSEFYGREDDRQVLEQLTKRFLTAIATLAGQPDFAPSLTGRFRKAVRSTQ